MSAGTRMILALNCGSSSVKFALFEARGADVPRQPVWKGKIDATGGAHPYRSAMVHVLECARARLGGRALDAISHRVVHGGETYTAPVRVDAAVLADLTGFVALAPLHQPFALEAIAALMADHPQMPQVACFDTAFHHTLPRVEQLLPLPAAVRARGLRRYGFHGLSYEYMAQVLPERHGERAHGRVIVAHLGSGASLCAMHAGRSVATSMGFSALDGLMMGTRSGSLDPGVLLYLLENDRMTVAELTHMLYRESGLAGVSGLSSELPVLLANEARTDDTGARVRDALALYVRRIVREIGALVAVLGGLDLLVFTAGVGEHSAAIRERVCGGLAFLGIVVDDAANQACSHLISAPASRVTVAVEPTDEEWIAARHAAGLLHNSHDQPTPIQGDRPCP
ncbi:acetate/propionate family kinase [Massilia sp. BSC265]|uniref:acetate/propionate family kinase n=1 Tax=Massilia sp. BSC265 TaxID=1549812 RepID=UPI00068E70C8|nr:acetate/propionate family kinase [Massilia sp. BSC265]